MKKQKILIRIVCLLCMLSFSGCGLFESVKTEQTISGRLFLDCDMEPLKNYEIETCDKVKKYGDLIEKDIKKDEF